MEMRPVTKKEDMLPFARARKPEQRQWQATDAFSPQGTGSLTVDLRRMQEVIATRANLKISRSTGGGSP